eukprot:7646450-Pyramimonas_sp.AAC.1
MRTSADSHAGKGVCSRRRLPGAHPRVFFSLLSVNSTMTSVSCTPSGAGVLAGERHRVRIL